MITDTSITIDAPPDVVWDVFADVERWATWTASIERIVPLDGPEIAVGSRFRIKQPRMPDLVWEVTEVEPGTSWTWVQRSPGGTTYAGHRIEPVADARCRVHQQIDQRGPVGVAVGAVTRRMTRRYLDLEGQGLKRTSEQRHRGAAAA